MRSGYLDLKYSVVAQRQKPARVRPSSFAAETIAARSPGRGRTIIPDDCRTAAGFLSDFDFINKEYHSVTFSVNQPLSRLTVTGGNYIIEIVTESN